MEWLISKLALVDRIYIEGAGSKHGLTPLVGAVVRLVDGDLFLGGQLGERVSGNDILLVLDDGDEIRIAGMDVEVIRDGSLLYLNASSITGRTKVLYIRNDDRAVRVSIGVTL